MSSLDFRSLKRELGEQGWDLKATTRGHWRAKPPDATKSIVHFSESTDPWAIRNAIKQLRMNGFAWNEQEPPSRVRVTQKEESPVKESPVKLKIVPERAPITKHEPATIPSAAPDVDTLFETLKDAKSYLSLATEHVAHTEAARRKACEDHGQAEKERDAAREAMLAAKIAFDEAFR